MSDLDLLKSGEHAVMAFAADDHSVVYSNQKALELDAKLSARDCSLAAVITPHLDELAGRDVVCESCGLRLRLASMRSKLDGRVIDVVRAAPVSSELMQLSDYVPADVLEPIAEIDSPSAALRAILQGLCRRFEAGAAIVFTVDGTRIDNIIYHSSCQVPPAEQIEINNIIKNYFEQTLIEHMSCGQYIDQPAAIKDSHPLEYALITEFKLKNLIMLPVGDFSHDYGSFFLICSVNPQHLPALKQQLRFYTTIIESLVKRRRMTRKLARLRDLDEKTEALNARAFERELHNFDFNKSLGVICAELANASTLNKRYGKIFTDDQLKLTFQCLKIILPGFPIYRSSGTVFTVILKDISRDKLESLTYKVRALLKSQHSQAAISSDFTDQPCTLDEFLYQLHRRDQNLEPVLIPAEGSAADEKVERDFKHLPRHPFFEYIKNFNFDELTVINSLSQPGQPFYFYFGDLKRGVFYLSDNLVELLGLTHNIVHDFLEIWQSKICNDNDRRLWLLDVKRCLVDPKHRHSLRYRVEDKDGNVLWLHTRGLVRFNARHEAVFASGSITRLDDLNLIDPITNMPREFAAVKEITRLIDHEHSCTVFGIKLDGLGEINEAIGHEAANHLIKRAAESLLEKFSESLNFYRLDGALLIALARSHDLDTEKYIREEMARLINKVYADFGFRFKRSAAITSIRYPEHLENAEELFEKMACFTAIAKQTDNEFIEFTEHDVDAQHRQASMVLELSASVENNFQGFSTVVQPLIGCAGSDYPIIGAEILVRWSRDNLNIGPAAFVPVLEQTKLIVQVGRFVFEEACKFTQKALRYVPDFFTSFNVSYVQVKADPNFVCFIQDTLQKYGLNGRHFVAELTETNFDAYPEKLHCFVESCRTLGIRLALDDFGNGYSSLNLLLKYPAEIIKLDRSLTLKVNESQNNLNFIKAVIYACHQFGRKVCVEGVETLQELLSIRKTQCDYIQGYHFYRPLKHTELITQLFLQSQSERLNAEQSAAQENSESK